MKKKVPSYHLVEERRKYTVALKIAGLSNDSILKSVNAQAATKGWGEVKLQTISVDIAQYYRENKALSVQDYDHLDQMREAHLAQIERTIEKLSIHISSKKDWKPFELADSLEKLHKMQMNLAEVQNWNYGKINQFNIHVSQQSPMKQFDEASTELQRRLKPKAVKEFSNYLQDLIDKMDEDEEEDVIEGEVIDSPK